MLATYDIEAPAVLHAALYEYFSHEYRPATLTYCQHARRRLVDTLERTRSDDPFLPELVAELDAVRDRILELVG